MNRPTAMIPHNKLLRSLPPEELSRLQHRLEWVLLKPRRVLHHARITIDHVYFVESGLVSVVANTDEENHGVEAWLIGYEGMVGIPVVLGMPSSPHRRMVQAEGSALRMKTPDLRQLMDDLPYFRSALLRYVGSVLVQAGQVGACNARHSLPERLARWLLMTRDRLDGNDLPLTHDVIAKMLGARRASVTEVVHTLVKSEAIAAERGLLRVLDRDKLEHLSCPCYPVLKAEFKRLSHPVDVTCHSQRQPVAEMIRSSGLHQES